MRHAKFNESLFSERKQNDRGALQTCDAMDKFSQPIEFYDTLGDDNTENMVPYVDMDEEIHESDVSSYEGNSSNHTYPSCEEIEAILTYYPAVAQKIEINHPANEHGLIVRSNNKNKKNVAEALQRPDRGFLKDVINKGLCSIRDRRTWKTEKIPREAKVLGI